jgi:hypothetical protein
MNNDTRVLGGRPAFALGAILALCGLGPACASVPKQTAAMQELQVTEMGSQELHFRLNTFTLHLPARIEKAAYEVYAKTDDPRVRFNILNFGVYSVPAYFRTLFQADAYTALLDTWALSQQLVDYYESGPGRDAFGPHQERLLGALRDLTSELQALEASTVRPEIAAESAELVGQWAREHPIDNHLFVREPVAPLAAKALFRRNPGLGDALANAETSIQQLSVRTAVYAEYLPKQIQWNLEALTLELTQGAGAVRNLEDVVPVMHYLDRIDTLLDDELELILTSAETMRSRTFTDIEGQTTALADAVSGQRRETLEAISREREAILAAVTEERRGILDQVGQERAAVTRDVEQILQGTFDQAEITSRQIVDLAFTRLLLLTAVWFVLLVAYRFLVHRLTARRESPA